MKTILLLTGVFSLLFHTALGQGMSMYISDAGNFNQGPWQILKFDADGQNGEVFIDHHLAWPQDIVFLEDENLVLISNLNSGKISRFDATTGAYIDDFATGIGQPTRMKFGKNGLLYVLQWQGNGKVWRYQRNGTFVDEFTAVGVGTSIGLDWDATGNLYVSSYGGKTVRKFSPSGADLGLFIDSGLSGPTNIWFDANGDLLVIDYNGSTVNRYDSEGNFKEAYINNISQGEGVDFLPDGKIILGSGSTSSVKLYHPNGAFIKDLVPPNTLNLLVPNAVVLREITSAVTTPVVYREETIVTPSVGVQFQVSQQEFAAGSLEVHAADGMFVQNLSFADSTLWDASGLSDGMYVFTMQMQDGVIARQKIVVSR